MMVICAFHSTIRVAPELNPRRATLCRSLFSVNVFDSIVSGHLFGRRLGLLSLLNPLRISRLVPGPNPFTLSFVNRATLCAEPNKWYLVLELYQHYHLRV